MRHVDVRPREHGGVDLGELGALGVDPARLVDFSVSVNPYGPHPSVVSAVRSASLDSYPDRETRRGRAAIARWLDVDPARVRLGNGAADLLWAAARALLSPPACLLSVEPSFSELGAAALSTGARVELFRGPEARAFAIDLSEVAVRARAAGAHVVALCSPSTPVGFTLRAQSVARWARRQPFTLVLDQSFLALSEAHEDRSVRMPDNVLVIRSLTKDHALPGLRVGYALGAPELLARLDAQRPAWSTSAPAEAAVVAASTLDTYVAECRARVLADRRALHEKLTELGLRPLPSSTGYLSVQVPEDSTALRARLLTRHAVLVRDCKSFGMPGYLRLGSRPVADHPPLLSALRAELSALGVPRDQARR